MSARHWLFVAAQELLICYCWPRPQPLCFFGGEMAGVACSPPQSTKHSASLPSLACRESDDHTHLGQTTNSTAASSLESPLVASYYSHQTINQHHCCAIQGEGRTVRTPEQEEAWLPLCPSPGFRPSPRGPAPCPAPAQATTTTTPTP